MPFDLEAYRKYWLEMRDRAVELSKAEVRDQNPLTIGNTDEYDGERKDCMMWEIDDGYINERLYDDSLEEGEAIEQYIMAILKEGPKCHFCIWNDGGPKSCVHPLIEDCKHPSVTVEVTWTLDMMQTKEFTGIDWKEATFQGYREVDEPVSFDGTATRVYSVTCNRCHQEIEQHKIDSDLLEAFKDEY